MKIEAKITKTLSAGNVKAIADVTLDGAVTIHGVKLIDSINGLFASMPSNKWQGQDGTSKHTDIVRVTDPGVKKEIDRTVSNAYFAQTQAADELDVSM